MKRIFLLIISVSLINVCYSQKITKTTPTINTDNNVSRPKLVVGIVIDQMRWDYLYRFYPVFSETGGFKRMLMQGFSCENTLIPYTPTVTAAGHTCIYTGSVPAIHGIVGNEWYDKELKREVFPLFGFPTRAI